MERNGDNMSYKLIAIDIDGTLLTSDKKLTEHSLNVMKEAEAAGLYCVLATGRVAANVKEIYGPLGLKSPCICSGGAQVVDGDFNMIHTCYIPNPIVKDILNFAKEKDVHVQIFNGENFYFEKQSKWPEIYSGISGLNPVVTPDLHEWPIEKLDTPKVLILAEPDRLLEVQAEAMERFPMLNIGRSRPTFLEMNNPEGNKGNALKALEAMLGLKQEELIAIGDNQIDESMILYAGLGVAIGNALDEIKDVSDYISPDNDHEGVAHVIEKFMLGREPKVF